MWTTNESAPGLQAVAPLAFQGPSARFDWERAVLASDLDPTARLVGLVLASHYNARDGFARPSQPTLAREAGLASVATVRKALGRLSDAGLVAWTKVPGVANANRYRLLAPQGETAPQGGDIETAPTGALSRETAPQGARDRSRGSAEQGRTMRAGRLTAAAPEGGRMPTLESMEAMARRVRSESAPAIDQDQRCSSTEGPGYHVKVSGSGAERRCSFCGLEVSWMDDAWRVVA